jgi:hypothetical protein
MKFEFSKEMNPNCTKWVRCLNEYSFFLEYYFDTQINLSMVVWVKMIWNSLAIFLYKHCGNCLEFHWVNWTLNDSLICFIKEKKVNLDLILAIIEFAFNNYFKLKKEL